MMQTPKLIPTLIVEDELASRKSLNLLIEKFCPELEVVGQAKNVEEAIQLINELKPELVFLDIHLPKMDGFHLLKVFPDPSFEVIFTTAYDQYATRAFRFAALDYLLKPIHYEELRQSVNRYKSRKAALPKAEQFNALIQNMQDAPQKIALPTMEGYQFIQIKEVIRCEADANYTLFHFYTNPKILVSKSLKNYEDLLLPLGFSRIHRSHIINLAYIEKYRKGKSPQVELKNGDVLTVSAARRDYFEQQLSSYIEGGIGG